MNFTPNRPMTANSPRKVDKTVTMDRQEFIAFAREQNEKRQQTAQDTYNEYSLTFIGSNPNDINSYGVCNDEGIVYQPKAGRDYVVGFATVNGYKVNPDTDEVCPDEKRVSLWNARLAAMGEASFVRCKHSRIRFLLWLELDEVN